MHAGWIPTNVGQWLNCSLVRNSTQFEPESDLAFGQHLLEFNQCALHYSVSWFKVLTTAHSQFYLSLLETVFVSRKKRICASKAVSIHPSIAPIKKFLLNKQPMKIPSRVKQTVEFLMFLFVVCLIFNYLRYLCRPTPNIAASRCSTSSRQSFARVKLLLPSHTNADCLLGSVSKSFFRLGHHNRGNMENKR